MAIAGMVLGIVALVFGWIPVVNWFISFPCLLVGIPLSGVALYQGIKNGMSIGMAVAGLATNVVALVFCIGWFVLFILYNNCRRRMIFRTQTEHNISLGAVVLINAGVSMDRMKMNWMN